jgi:hypothetical protein
VQETKIGDGPAKQELVLQTLIAIIHRMLNQGINEKQVTKASEEVMKKYKLDHTQKSTIKHFIENVAAAMKEEKVSR